MDAPLRLSAENFARAAAFLRQARPLERSLFEYHFNGGAVPHVHAALRTLQNDDGGFHGLEADLGIPASTVLSTCHALHCLEDLATPATHSIVAHALDFLRANYDPVHGVWPIIPPHDNSQPHAPWWHFSRESAENWTSLADNPRPDVLACLLAFPSAQDGDLVRRVTSDTIGRVHQAGGKMEMHGLLCYLRLRPAPNLAPELAAELDRSIPALIEPNLARDPTQWSGYGLRPLDIAPRRDSPWRPLISREVERHLDYLIATQATDGSWHPHWNWGDAFPEAWPQAKLRWQAVLTLANLRILRSYGRLPG
ncbi:MAG: hypothetical protein ACHQ4G_05500 [Opitutales bacterium]